MDTFCSFQRFVTLAQASVSVTVSVQVPSQVLCFIKPLSLTLLWWFRSTKLVLLETIKRPIQIWNYFSYCCRRAVGLFFRFLLGPIFGMDILYMQIWRINAAIFLQSYYDDIRCRGLSDPVRFMVEPHFSPPSREIFLIIIKPNFQC